jgi:serine/threonine protein phosphatase PrpC
MPAADGALPFIVAGESDPGRQRSVNQDRLMHVPVRLPTGEATLLVVADGMGGAAGGEVASKQAVVELMRVLGQTAPGRSDGESLADGIAAANRAVYDQARAFPELHGMGTTLVAALVRDQQAVVAHVGDSRAYLIRDGRPYRLTVDHSWVAEQVRAGDLTEQEAAASNLRNVLTKSIGTQPGVIPEVSEPFALRPGDALVLCSDGLHGVVDDATIAAAVRDVEPAVAVRRLIDLANHNGGPDNVTVVIGRLGTPVAVGLTNATPPNHAGVRSPAVATSIRRRAERSSLGHSRYFAGSMIGAILLALGIFAIGFVPRLGSGSGSQQTGSLSTVQPSVDTTSGGTRAAGVPPTSTPTTVSTASQTLPLTFAIVNAKHEPTNVRSGPGTSYRPVQVRQGTALVAIGRLTNQEGTWLLVSNQAVSGWIGEDVVNVTTGSVALLPVVRFMTEIPDPSNTPPPGQAPTPPPIRPTTPTVPRG